MSRVARWTSRRHTRALMRNYFTAYGAHGPRKGDRVVVAMSGGVDSSVAALLLSQKDYDLSAVYMRNWDTRDESGSDTGCEWEKDWEDVQRVCNRLKLPCELVDLSAQYWTRVFEPALRDWEDGQATPNPDTVNKYGGWLATGHYANVSWTMEGRPRLMRGRDPHKDQSFFLSSVPEASLCKALFPLGTLTKSDVRQLAHNADLPTALRAESMGLCFLTETDVETPLAQYLPPKPGEFVDMNGKILGEHQGLWRYTIGQCAKLPGMQERMFVLSKNPINNRIVIAPGTDHPALYCNSMTMHNWTWIWPDFRPSPHFQATVQVRHNMRQVPCTVGEESPPGTVKITFANPEKAVAPGQTAVIWDHDWCLGCGTIAETSA